LGNKCKGNSLAKKVGNRGKNVLVVKKVGDKAGKEREWGPIKGQPKRKS